MGLGRVSGVSAADGARATAEEGFDIPPLVAGAVAGDRLFGPTAGPGVHGRPTSAPARLPREGRGWGATSCVTLRQACRRPNGFGRNLRSKTRWFTGFCNSHQVSHFATFFIDARAEISVAESRSSIEDCSAPGRLPRRGPGRRDLSFQLPWRGPRPGFVPAGAGSLGGRAASRGWRGSGAGPRPRTPSPRVFVNVFAGLSVGTGLDNDPSAGSPTETLLRLLLPLNDKVQWTSRDVAGGEPPTSPRSEHFTGPFNR